MPWNFRAFVLLFPLLSTVIMIGSSSNSSSTTLQLPKSSWKWNSLSVCSKVMVVVFPCPCLLLPVARHHPVHHRNPVFRPLPAVRRRHRNQEVPLHQRLLHQRVMVFAAIPMNDPTGSMIDHCALKVRRVAVTGIGRATKVTDPPPVSTVKVPFVVEIRLRHRYLHPPPRFLLLQQHPTNNNRRRHSLIRQRAVTTMPVED